MGGTSLSSFRNETSGRLILPADRMRDGEASFRKELPK